MKKRSSVFLALGLCLLGTVGARAEDLAKVGGESISRDEFENKAQIEEGSLKRKLSKDDRLALLRSLVNQRLLVAEAKRQKLDRTPDHKSLMLETERKDLADRVYAAEVSNKVQISPEDAKQFYEKNPGAFDVAEVSQILVEVLPGQEAVAEKKAQTLLASLVKAPKTFAAVAKAQSDDTQSKSKGGDLGALRRGMMIKALEDAVFQAKPGSVVGPVHTQFGFHLLHVRSLKHLAWDKASVGLQQELQRLQAMQLQQALLEKLSKKDKVNLSAEKL